MSAEKSVGALSVLPGIDEPTLEQTDETLLAVVLQRRRLALATERTLSEELDRVTQAGSVAAEEERMLAQRIETEEQRIADLADGVRAQLDRLSEAAADVPKPLRPKLPDFDRLAKLRPEEMSTGPTQRLAQEAKARLAKLGRTGKQLERARLKVERARGARVALEERVTNEVALPATSNRAELLRAGDRLSEVASSLDRSFEPPAIDDDASIAALLQATRDLTASQAQLLRRAEKLVKAQTGLADREAEILASVLEQAGATDVETVQGLAVEAEVAASTAKTALESAKEGARRAKSLDDQLSVGSELVDDLARLMALLTNRSSSASFLLDAHRRCWGSRASDWTR